MLKKISIVISSIALGVFGGGAVGWLVGRTIYFFATELPNRNLTPEQFRLADCNLRYAIGTLTLFVLIPAGVILGSVIGFGVGMAQEKDDKC